MIKIKNSDDGVDRLTIRVIESDAFAAAAIESFWNWTRLWSYEWWDIIHLKICLYTFRLYNASKLWSNYITRTNEKPSFSNVDTGIILGWSLTTAAVGDLAVRIGSPRQD